MWLLRYILITVLIVTLVWVAVQNSEPRVDVRLFGFTFLEVRLFLVMFACAIAGFAVGLFVATLREVTLRMKLGREQRERALLEREVSDLRAAPVRGLDLGPTETTGLPTPKTE